MVSQTVFSLAIFGRDTTSKFTNFPDLWPTVQRKLCNMRPPACTSVNIREDHDCRKQLVDMKFKMEYSNSETFRNLSMPTFFG